MSNIYTSNLISPNGGEEYSSSFIDISWEQGQVDIDSYTYTDIYFCENYIDENSSVWNQIGRVPCSTYSYRWNVSGKIKTEKARIKIEMVSFVGIRSIPTFSANNFSINSFKIDPPVVLSPISGFSFGQFVKIIFDEGHLLNSYSSRLSYYLYYYSRSSNISKKPIVENYPIGRGPIIWDTSELPVSSDYEIIIYIKDKYGSTSAPVIIKNLSFSKQKYFLIDTKPPEVFVQIQKNGLYTKEKEVPIRIYSYDDTTDTHAMQFIESYKDDDGVTKEVKGSAENVANIKYWGLSPGDGEKVIQAKIQDYGANRAENIQNIKKIIYDAGIGIVSDICVSGNKIYFSVNDNEKGTLYSYDSFLVLEKTFDYEIVSIGAKSTSVLVSLSDDIGRARVYQYSFGKAEDFFISDVANTQISCFSEFNGNIYMGSISGSLYVYNNSSISSIKEYGDSVKNLYSDGVYLYILICNSGYIDIYDSSTFNRRNING